MLVCPDCAEFGKLVRTRPQEHTGSEPHGEVVTETWEQCPKCDWRGQVEELAEVEDDDNV